MKRILVTSTDMMMIQFLVPHVLYLREQGYDVEVACSEVGNRFEEVQNFLGGDKTFKVRLHRNPLKLGNLKGLTDLKRIINGGNYDLIWTNEPVMGIMTRLAAKKARKNGVKVIYLTHGYHFFKGGQFKYKLFYPIEKAMSRYCDVIMTVNYEDYELSKKKFHAKKVVHIDGIGLDVQKFGTTIDEITKRKELGVTEDAFVILSVGELKPHKNHKTVIDAIAQIDRKNIIYLICGKGELLNKLQKKAKRLRIEEKVKFLGYRKDVHEIMQCADIFVFPSKREGLGLASLEAMAAGLPIVGAKTRGVVDYVVDDKTGYLCGVEKPNDYASAILKLYDNQNKIIQMSLRCKEAVIKYDIKTIQQRVFKEIEELMRL